MAEAAARLQAAQALGLAGASRGAEEGQASHLPPDAIIKSGFLKKANHHSMGSIWKTKLVEIRPGLFLYEDDDNILGRR
jgi:hypothetical protein